MLEMNMTYKQILIKNKNSKRSFIQPTQELRIKECENKFIIKEDIKHKHNIAR